MADKRHRILVVDDLPDWRETLGGLLVDAGYDILVACSYASALRLLAANHFDLAVLDIRLDETDDGNTDGLDLAAEIKSRWPMVKVVIITGYADVKMMKEALQPGLEGIALAFAFLEKSEADRLPEYVERAFGCAVRTNTT